MTLDKDLKRGVHGLQLSIPDHWILEGATDTAVKLTDPEMNAMWHLFWFPGLHLDARESKWIGLREAAKAHARLMFDVQRAQFDADGPSRMDNPEWSPLVEYAPTSVNGAFAVRVVHRMLYQQGLEHVFGHLLVPRSTGLFEARVGTLDRTTGYRECAKIIIAEQAGGQVDLASPPSQEEYDDPALDEAFPDHCLSRARRALRWLGEEGLTAQPQVLPEPKQTVVLATLECRLNPPERFFSEAEGVFTRTSFSGTDGVEQLFVKQLNEAPVRPNQLEKLAVKRTRELHEDSEVESIELTTSSHRLPGDREGTLVIVDGVGHQGALRNGLFWLCDSEMYPWFIMLRASPALSRETMSRELLMAASSWQEL